MSFLKSAKSTGKQRKEPDSDESRAQIELHYLGRGPKREEEKFTDYGIFLMVHCFQCFTSAYASVECDRISNHEMGEAQHVERRYKDFIPHSVKSN